MTQWKLRRRGRTVGPLPTSELLRALQLGRVPLDSEAQRVGDDGWAPLASFPEFAEEIARDTPTHIMSSPWFLDSSSQRDRAQFSDSDPTEVFPEGTPLPGVAQGNLGVPPMPAPNVPRGLTVRGPMATIPDPSPPNHHLPDFGTAGVSPGFVSGDAEPITPRVQHQVVPAAAVPPAEEMSARRSRTSVRASASPTPPEAIEGTSPIPLAPTLHASAQDTSFGSAPRAETASASAPRSTGPEQLSGAKPAQSRESPAPGPRPAVDGEALFRSLLQDRPPPASSRFNPAKPGLGGAASPLDAMLARMGGPTQPGTIDPGPPQELTPLSGTPIPIQEPPANPTLPHDELRGGVYADDDLQDAAFDGDAESQPDLSPAAQLEELGPVSMNRVESHGPAPIPPAHHGGRFDRQETTSPALRVPSSTPPAGGRSVLWVLILILTLALGATMYAILAR